MIDNEIRICIEGAYGYYNDNFIDLIMYEKTTQNWDIFLRHDDYRLFKLNEITYRIRSDSIYFPFSLAIVYCCSSSEVSKKDFCEVFENRIKFNMLTKTITTQLLFLGVYTYGEPILYQLKKKFVSVIKKYNINLFDVNIATGWGGKELMSSIVINCVNLVNEQKRDDALETQKKRNGKCILS